MSDPAGLERVAFALQSAERVALDLETTGLDPRRDRVRLLSLATDTIDGGQFAYLVDCAAVDPRPLFAPLADREILAHHAAFDLGFLARLGFSPGAGHQAPPSGRGAARSELAPRAPDRASAGRGDSG